MTKKNLSFELFISYTKQGSSYRSDELPWSLNILCGYLQKDKEIIGKSRKKTKIRITNGNERKIDEEHQYCIGP